MLWNTINYTYCSPNSESKPALLDLLSIHLTWSKMAPLFVEILAHGEINNEVESVATLLRLHLWRCQLLELKFSRAQMAELFLPIPQGVPFLRYLSLHLSLAIEPAYSLLNTLNTPPVQEKSKHLCLFLEDCASVNCIPFRSMSQITLSCFFPLSPT